MASSKIFVQVSVKKRSLLFNNSCFAASKREKRQPNPYINWPLLLYYNFESKEKKSDQYIERPTYISVLVICLFMLLLLMIVMMLTVLLLLLLLLLLYKIQCKIQIISQWTLSIPSNLYLFIQFSWLLLPFLSSFSLSFFCFFVFCFVMLTHKTYMKSVLNVSVFIDD